jgi:transcription initiation factor TFIIB
MDYFSQLSQLDEFLEQEKNEEPVKKKLESCEKKCQYCNAINSFIYDYRNATEICGECGVIIDNIEDQAPEWRYYGASDNKNVDPTRCGGPINPLLPKSSMGTCMTGVGNYRHINRLHKWNQMPADERSLYEVFKKIDTIIKNFQINTKIVEETKEYYKILSEKEEKVKGYLTRGNIRISLIASCMFVACKNNGKPMREIEIANIFGITSADVTKGLKKFGELEKNKNIQINGNENNIHDYINKYCSQLNIDNKITKLIHLIYIRAKKINILRNSNNTSICSGLLYFVSEIIGITIKKSKIISIINVSEVTLNKVYKEFVAHEKILLIGFNKINGVEVKQIIRKKRKSKIKKQI